MNNLALLRTQNGETQKRIAQTCGISERSYRRIESGTVKPSCDVVIALQRHFNKPIDYLLEQVDDTHIVTEPRSK